MRPDAHPAGDKLIQTIQHSAAAGHQQAVFLNIRHQLGRGLLHHRLQRRDDALHLDAQRHLQLVAGKGDLLRQAGHQVAALHLYGLFRLALGPHGTDLPLDSVGGGIADKDIVGAAHIPHNGRVHLVAGHLYRALADDAV